MEMLKKDNANLGLEKSLGQSHKAMVRLLQ